MTIAASAGFTPVSSNVPAKRDLSLHPKQPRGARVVFNPKKLPTTKIILRGGKQTCSPAVYPTQVACAVLAEVFKTSTVVSTAPVQTVTAQTPPPLSTTSESSPCFHSPQSDLNSSGMIRIRSVSSSRQSSQSDPMPCARILTLGSCSNIWYDCHHDHHASKCHTLPTHSRRCIKSTKVAASTTVTTTINTVVTSTTTSTSTGKYRVRDQTLARRLTK